MQYLDYPLEKLLFYAHLEKHIVFQTKPNKIMPTRAQNNEIDARERQARCLCFYKNHPFACECSSLYLYFVMILALEYVAYLSVMNECKPQILSAMYYTAIVEITASVLLHICFCHCYSV